MIIITIFLIFLFTHATVNSAVNLTESDTNILEFPLNIEYLEAEFYLFSTLGKGLDSVQPDLADGGPPPIGAKQANLSPLIRDIILQFGYEEVGHVRAIKSTVKGFPRPLLNISTEAFATVINNAFGSPLSPPFDPYANDINYLIASYIIPYVGLTGYVGAIPELISPISRKLVAGLLGIEGGQDAVIRTLLYERKNQKVVPYGITVDEFTIKISQLRNKLGNEGIKDEGLTVPIELGADKKIEGNVLAGDEDSLSYSRTPEEILRILYGSGNEKMPGGFYPKGADGKIAREYLNPGM